MDFASLGIASVAAITVVCYLIGMAVKASGLNDKWIPVIMGVCGLVLGTIRSRTGSVWPGMLLHTLNNLLVFAAG